MSRRASAWLGTAALAVSLAGPAAGPAHADTYSYKATWGGGLAQTRCDGLPAGQCDHDADSAVAYTLGANFCNEAVVRNGEATPLFNAGFECRATLDASSYGVKESRGACIGAPRGITTNGNVVVESIYLPAPISVPVRVVNKNGAGTVKGSVFVLGGTATVSAKFTAVCTQSDPKRGVWSGTFTYERAV